MYEVRPYDSMHMQAIDLREHEEKSIGKARLDLVASNSKTFTYFWEGTVFGMAGHLELWPGVAEVFIIPSRYIPQHPFFFMAEVRETLDRWVRENGYHRIQTASIDNRQTNRWMELLGFTCEGILSKYSSDGLDFRMWARITPNGG